MRCAAQHVAFPLESVRRRVAQVDHQSSATRIRGTIPKPYALETVICHEWVRASYEVSLVVLPPARV